MFPFHEDHFDAADPVGTQPRSSTSDDQIHCEKSQVEKIQRVYFTMGKCLFQFIVVQNK